MRRIKSYKEVKAGDWIYSRAGKNNRFIYDQKYPFIRIVINKYSDQIDCKHLRTSSYTLSPTENVTTDDKDRYIENGEWEYFIMNEREINEIKQKLAVNNL